MKKEEYKGMATISEFIKRLTDLLAEHGDIAVDIGYLGTYYEEGKCNEYIRFTPADHFKPLDSIWIPEITG
jgi:hypothetical protein